MKNQLKPIRGILEKLLYMAKNGQRDTGIDLASQEILAFSSPSVKDIEKVIENHITHWIVAGGILSDIKGLAEKIHNIYE